MTDRGDLQRLEGDDEVIRYIRTDTQRRPK
jgi:hypothetical protein